MDRKWIALIVLAAVIVGVLLYLGFAGDTVPRINIEPALQYVANGPPTQSLQEATDDAIINNPQSPPKAKSGRQTSRREEECRRILEDHYKVPFEPTRTVPWLTNPETGRKLELDGYNADLRIAFEYNGVQHYDYPNHVHKNEGEFIAQKRRDLFKHKQCDANGVYLITIPHTVKDLHAHIARSIPVDPKTPEIGAMYTYDDQLL